MRSYEIITEAISSQELKNKLDSLGLKLIPIPYDAVYQGKDAAGNPIRKSTKTSPIVNYDGRIMVLVDVSGTYIPFYISTGEGGKKNVPIGKWYPIFGIGDSWLNKGTEEDIVNFYGSSKLKSVAQTLDSKLGNLLGTPYEIIPMFWSKGSGKQVINTHLHPVNNEDGYKATYDNINATLKRLGEKPIPLAVKKLTLTHGSMPPLTFNISAPVGRNVVKKFGDDSKFWDDEQFKLEKSDGEWKLIPNASATNKTMIDGKAVTGPTVLKTGMKIAVGNPDKNIEKLPLMVS